MLSKNENKENRGRPTKTKKKKQYTLTMDENLHDDAVKMADEMGISFSSLVSMALKSNMHKQENE